VSIVLKLQVPEIVQFDLLYDWCSQAMWPISRVPDNPKDDTAMARHGAEALCSANKSLMHAIWIEVEEIHQDMAHQIVQSA